MNMLRALADVLFGSRPASPRSCTLLCLSGNPPGNDSEALVYQLAQGRQLVPTRWLEERIAEMLYHDELRRGGWVSDIGVWGPSAFRGEAAHLLAEVRTEFGVMLANPRVDSP